MTLRTPYDGAPYYASYVVQASMNLLLASSPIVKENVLLRLNVERIN